MSLIKTNTETTGENLIIAEHLSKVYRSFWGLPRVRALNGVDFAVPRGSVFGLLGPNGSGKTTIIKLLLGLARPTSGRAVVLGKPAGDQKARARIGYLPEESYLYSFLSGDQTLDFYGKLFGLNKRIRRERSEHLLDTMGLDKRDRRRKVGSYSKGMARIIGLAQALINDPDLIILDEPTTGLDPIGTLQMKELIKELQKQGKTVFLSSHLLADVEDVCDRILILYRGQVKIIGAVDELLSLKDVFELRARNVSAEIQNKLTDMVETSGAETISAGAQRARLEELFKRVVAEEVEKET